MNESYDALVANLARRRLQPDELAAVRSESVARGDVATQIKLHLLAERTDLAEEVARAAPASAASSLAEGLGAWEADSTWRALLAFAQTHPEATPTLSEAVRLWHSEVRWTPPEWVADLRSGRTGAHQRLVRRLELRSDEVALLFDPRVADVLDKLDILRVSGDEALSRMPELSGFHHVTEAELRGTWTPSAAEALAWSRALPAVEVLDVGGAMDADHIATLWTGSAFPRLRHLTISSPTWRSPSAEFRDVGPERSGPRVTLTRQHRTSETWCRSPIPVTAVADALQGRSLGRPPFTLELKGLWIGESSICRLLEESAFLGLSGLVFTFCELTASDVAQLADARLELDELVLHMGTVGAEGGAALARARWAPGVKRLSLNAHRIGDTAGAALVRALDGGSLTALEANYNDLGHETARALASGHLPHLEQLSLLGNPLPDEPLSIAMGPQVCPSLVRVDLMSTGMGPRTEAVLEARGMTSWRPGSWRLPTAR